MGRDGGLPPDREARRAAADHAPRLHALRAMPEVRRRHRPGARPRRAGLLGLPAGRRERADGPRRRRGPASPSCARASPARSAWRTAGWSPRCARRRWRDFAAGRTRLLVATTVIEVGVDVPEATRDGDRACRALRPRPAAPAARPGRPRRGGQLCLLLHDDGAGPGERASGCRSLRDTEDGFVIADEDFRLRGGGEVLGTRQSGAAGLPPRPTRGRGAGGADRTWPTATRPCCWSSDPRLTGPRGAGGAGAAARCSARTRRWRRSRAG